MEVTCPSGLVGEVRRIKGHELVALAEAADSDNANDSVNAIVNGCWQKTIDAGPYPFVQMGDAKPPWLRVATGDVMYLLLRLRAMSIASPGSDPGPWGPGDSYDFDVKCGGCGDLYGWTVQLSDLPVQLMPDTTRDAISQQQTLKVKVGGVEYGFTVQNGERMGPVNKLRKQQKRRKGTIVDVLTAQTLSITGLEDPKNVARRYQRIVDLDNIELQELQAAYEKADGGVQTAIETVCSECRHRQEIELPMGKAFFSPKLRPKPEAIEDEELNPLRP